MLLLIDNYDSFTYNLYQYLCELGAEVEVVRNDKTTIEDIEDMRPEGIVVSPGPCTPREAGISNDVIRHFGPKLPVLGVCLGHQCIGDAYGATVDRAGEIRHGKTSMIHHDGKGVFAGLPNPFEGIRYHSLVIYPETMPDFLEVTAWTDNGLIMGVRHKELPVEGVQFQPRVDPDHGGTRPCCATTCSRWRSSTVAGQPPRTSDYRGATQSLRQRPPRAVSGSNLAQTNEFCVGSKVDIWSIVLQAAAGVGFNRRARISSVCGSEAVSAQRHCDRSGDRSRTNDYLIRFLRTSNSGHAKQRERCVCGRR